ncbi:hypothetical protein [Actinomadura napierensis]|uniref:Uncharacterized protein n=1 Tax=Actinomadura napierensis TaxID=267854 RepID=A0ABN2YDS5_9ACTN
MSSDSDQWPAGAREPAPERPGPATGPPESAPPAPDSLVPPPEPVPLPVDADDVAEAVTDVTAGGQGDVPPEVVRERLRRRAIFLRELAEARELRRRVTPHRSRRARIHAALRRRTFRIN